MSIDRFSILHAHSPVNTCMDPWSPFSVGNGDFAFTVDATGLQTFPELYDNEAIPLTTESAWGWHTSPYSPERPAFDRKGQRLTPYSNGQRTVMYCTHPLGMPEGFDWLRKNPHRFNLGQLGLFRASALRAECVSDIRQRLNLYDGQIESAFLLDGVPVRVKTGVLPEMDAVALHLESASLGSGLGVRLRFPYPSPEKNGGDFGQCDGHSTSVVVNLPNRVQLLREIDDTRYFVTLQGGFDRIEETDAHGIFLSTEEQVLDLLVSFSKSSRVAFPADPWAEIGRFWHDYWEMGGFVAIHGEFAEARELQRRIVLSQYLTMVNCAGTLPPQETGLTFNSWYGKFHLEMHWWHSAHFPLWQRPRLLEKSMWYYRSILPRAREIARQQGYKGARWPKMTDESGYDSPSNIGPLLIWQQPHPIYYCELLYRQRPSVETLRLYRDIVAESAEFMADYARLGEDGRYHLGPGMIPAQENHNPEDTVDPPLELAYWAWGLNAAADWLERLGEPSGNWRQIAKSMAPPPCADGRYLAADNCPTYTPVWNYDHPSMVGALGFMTGIGTDPKIMENTLRAVLEEDLWQLDTGVWGWDFPMLAMTAARLGLPELAVRALLYPSKKNVYLNNGHNRQADRESLPIYLPGNGGLLMAVGMMCAGWDGAEGRHAPGFPESWRVEYESISPMP